MSKARKGREFKIPKPPRTANGYATYSKEQFSLMGGNGPEKVKAIAAQWKELSADEQAKYSRDGELDHERKMKIWYEQAGEREARRIEHCAKLKVAKDTTWEQLKKIYDGRQVLEASGGSGGRSGGREAASTSTLTKSERSRKERLEQQMSASAAASAAGGALEGKRRKVTATAGDSAWQQCWEPNLRKKAILRGLDRIFRMAQDEENFRTFGNDMIQCFYDVATVSGEPVRARALKYVEQMAHRWKHSVMQQGWISGVERDPNPTEVVDVLIGMYCMERVGIHHPVKMEVEAFMAREPPLYTCVDYLGWDPTKGPPPHRLAELTSGQDVSVFRTMSNSLIHTFYAERVGMRLGCSYKDVFTHLERFRPWCGPDDLSPQDYTDQCYLVTHVVFTLNNWGELSLDPDLMPHEYYFSRNHLSTQISKRDVHLVGEFIEVLRAFGVPDSDLLIQAGLKFLMSTQDDEGLWDADSVSPYTTYHATMVGVQALLAHQYRGYGPGITSVEPLIRQWAKAEASSGHVTVGEESRLHRGKGLGSKGGMGQSRGANQTFSRVSLATDESLAEGGTVKTKTDDGNGETAKATSKSEGESEGGPVKMDAPGGTETEMGAKPNAEAPLVVLSTGLVDDRAEKLLAMADSIKGGGYKGPKILCVPEANRPDPVSATTSTAKPAKLAKPLSPKGANSSGDGGGAPERRPSASSVQAAPKKGEKRPRSDQASTSVDAAPVKKKTSASTAVNSTSSGAASGTGGGATRSPIETARLLLDRLTNAQASGDMAVLLRVLEKLEKLEVSMAMLKEVPLGKAISKISKKIADPACKALAGEIRAKWTSTLAS